MPLKICSSIFMEAISNVRLPSLEPLSLSSSQEGTSTGPKMTQLFVGAGSPARCPHFFWFLGSTHRLMTIVFLSPFDLYKCSYVVEAEINLRGKILSFVWRCMYCASLWQFSHADLTDTRRDVPLRTHLCGRAL